MNAVTEQIIGSLQRRRQNLGMPLQVLAKRANLGPATVQRALCAGASVRLDTLLASARGLEMTIFTAEDRLDSEILADQAQNKTRQLAGIAQASAGLEGQAVSDEVRKDVERQITINLLAGSKKRLWAT